jgi:hypothetical protein
MNFMGLLQFSFIQECKFFCKVGAAWCAAADIFMLVRYNRADNSDSCQLSAISFQPKHYRRAHPINLFRHEGLLVLPPSVEQYIHQYYRATANIIRGDLERYQQGDSIHRAEVFLAILHLSQGSAFKVNLMVSDLLNGRKRFVLVNGSGRAIPIMPPEALMDKALAGKALAESFVPYAPRLSRPPLPELPEAPPTTGATPVVPSPAIRLNPPPRPAPPKPSTLPPDAPTKPTTPVKEE